MNEPRGSNTNSELHTLRQRVAELEQYNARLQAVIGHLSQTAHREQPPLEDNQLADDQQLFQRIARMTPVMLFVYDLLAQRDVYINHAPGWLQGYADEELQDNAAFLRQCMRLDDADSQTAQQDAWKNANDDDVIEREYRLRTSSGEWRWFHCRSSIFARTASGEPWQIIGMVQDMSEQQRALQALQESEERFHLVTLATRDAIYDWDMRAGTVWRNEVFHQLVGASGPLRSDPRWWKHHIHPDDRESVLASLAEVVHGGQHVWMSEYRLRRMDGTYAVVSDRCYIVRDAAGEGVRMLGAVTDITERRQTEARQFMQLTVSHLLAHDDAIGVTLTRVLEVIALQSGWQVAELWQIDPAQHTVHCTAFWCEQELANSAFIRLSTTLAMGKGELLPGQVWASKQPQWLNDIASNPQFVRAEAAAAVGLQSALAFPVGTWPHENGVVCLFSRARRSHDAELAQMLMDIGNHISQFIERKQAETALVAERASLARRVAERTAELSRANVELARAVRAKDNFLATMSHELRTPLNAVLGFSEALSEDIYGPLNDQQREVLGLIEESGRHLLSLITDILDLSKIEAGKMTLQLDTVLIEALCASCLRFIRQQAAHKQLEVLFRMHTSVRSFQADERRIKQVLINLLSNAVKFTPEQGQIGLNVSSDDERDTISFTVWDSGVGIQPEHMARLFKPFEQLEDGLNRRHQGTGLGLSLVARLTELHGGSVTVESQAAEGSRFIISLPRQHAEHPSQDMPHDPAAVAAAEGYTTKPPLILLAEDNETTIHLLTDHLVRLGYRVTVARTGAEALQRAQEERPALIVMDMQMPGMDGLEATRRIRENAAFTGLPIIALTALAMPGDDERFLAAGANEYLSKPVDLKKLVRAIEKHLA